MGAQERRSWDPAFRLFCSGGGGDSLLPITQPLALPKHQLNQDPKQCNSPIIPPHENARPRTPILEAVFRYVQCQFSYCKSIFPCVRARRDGEKDGMKLQVLDVYPPGLISVSLTHTHYVV